MKYAKYTAVLFTAFWAGGVTTEVIHAILDHTLHSMNWAALVAWPYWAIVALGGAS